MLTTQAQRPPGSFEYYWDTVAEEALSRYITSIEGGFIESSLARLGAPPELVVDAGAGSGRFTRLLASRARQVIATEMVEPLVGMLAGIAPNVNAVRMARGSTSLPVDDGAADAIIAIDVADFTQNSAFHRECHRALRPGGLFITTLQNRASWKGLIGRFRTNHHRAEVDAIYYTWSLRNLIDSLGDAGLQLDCSLGFNWLPFTRDSDSPLVAPLAQLERLLQLRRLPGVSPWVMVAARRDDDGVQRHS